jgi:hypothetical protein
MTLFLATEPLSLPKDGKLAMPDPAVLKSPVNALHDVKNCVPRKGGEVELTKMALNKNPIHAIKLNASTLRHAEQPVQLTSTPTGLTRYHLPQ